MEHAERAYKMAEELFWRGIDLVSALLLQLEIWLRVPMSQAGMSSKVQVVGLIAISLVMLLVALRVFAGLVRLVVFTCAAALAIHLLMTQVHIPT